MKLSEIIDIEYQFYRDSESDEVNVRERDRKIGMNYTGNEEDRVSMFRFWLQNLKDKGIFPGERFDSALTFLRYLVFFFFLISGAVSCAGILAYDGSRPVNIVNFIAVFAALQILLYLLFLLNLLPAHIRKKLPLIGDFYRLAGFIFKHIIINAARYLNKNKTKSINHISGIFYRIGSRHVIYNHIERWLLFSITQLGGLAFSLGALFACAYLVIFSDLAFAWNTTLDVSPGFFHRIVTVISAPWALLSGDLVPTKDLVESTRYFRLDGNYSGILSSALTAGGWWPFLLCILIFYGLIPRSVFLIISGLKLVYSLNKAPWLSLELDSLYRRLTSPLYISQSEETSLMKKNILKQEWKNSGEYGIEVRSCFLIVWGEIEMPDSEIRKIIKSVFNWDTLDILYAGGFDNHKDEEILKRFEDNSDTAPVLFIAESWEAPGKAVEHFLSRLRKKINKNRRIIIGLINLDHEKKFINPAQTDWQNWQDTVLRLKDPFIAIEPVTEALQ